MNAMRHYQQPELMIEGIHLDSADGTELPSQEFPVIDKYTPFGVYMREVLNVHDEPYTFPPGYYDPELQMYIEASGVASPPPTAPYGTPIWTPSPRGGGRPDGTVTDR